MHGEPAAYNVLVEESDNEVGAEKGTVQEANKNDKGKEMHGSGEGCYSFSLKRAHIPALEEQRLRKKVSVSNLGKSSRE
jgi:hypothetical protein